MTSAAGSDLDAYRLTPRASWFICALAIAFAALIGVSLFFVTKNYRPTLNWDQWGDLKFLIDIKNGTFSISELFAQNNEHRQFTGRLFYMIDAFFFDYRNNFLVAAIFASHLLLGGLVTLLWFNRNYDSRLRAAACIGGAATMVAIVQYDNLIWGFQIVWSQVYMFGLLALFALRAAYLQTQHPRRLVLLALYVALYALSAFTMANGLLVAGAGVALIVFSRARLLDLFVVVASALIVTAAYMYHYHAPGQHHLTDQVRDLPRVLLYTSYLLGAPLTSYHSLRVLFGAVGAALLFLAVAVGIWELTSGQRMAKGPAILTCMAGFAFASAFTTGIGRSFLGLEQAASGRYATVALVFWLSISGFVYWLIADRVNIFASARGKETFAVIALAAMLVQDIRFDANATTQRLMAEWALRIDRASVAIINNVYFTEGAGLDVLYVPSVIKERARLLRAYGWSIFSPNEKTYAPPLQLVAGLPTAGVPTCRGFVDSVIRLDGQRLALRGWLLASATPQSPSWIFVRDELNGVVGYFFPLDWRPDLANKYGPAAGNGYLAGVDFKRPIPTGSLKISFVAVFDRGPERICTLASELKVPAYEIASDYGEVPGRPIEGLQAAARGRAKAEQGWPPGYVALPVPNDKLFTVGLPSSEPAAVTFRFDAAKLGSDDLAIPVAANTGYDFPVQVLGPGGAIASLTLYTLNYDVWKFWRLAIIPRALLPAADEIAVSVQLPAKIPADGATVGPPFATPANPNRAALY